MNEKNREFFNFSIFSCRGSRLQAIIYEEPDEQFRGISGLRFAYQSLSDPSKTEITPLLFSRKGSVTKSVGLDSDEYIILLTTGYFEYDGKKLVRLKFVTNKGKEIKIGYDNAVCTEEGSYDTPEGFEYYAFKGEFDEETLLFLIPSEIKRSTDIMFNHMPYVQGNGDLKKIHFFLKKRTNDIIGVKFEYSGYKNIEVCNTLAGSDVSCRCETIDLTRYFRSDDYVKEIFYECIENNGTAYIKMIKIITNRTKHTVGRKINDRPYHSYRLRVDSEMQIYSLKGTYDKEDRHLTSLYVSMCRPASSYTGKDEMEAESERGNAFGDSSNEFIEAKNGKKYSRDELAKMFNATYEAADEISKRNLKNKEFFIKSYYLPQKLIKKRHLVFRAMRPQDIEYIVPNKKTYSKAAERRPDVKPAITQKGQNEDQKKYATVLRIAAVSDSSQPVSQFTSNAFNMETATLFGKKIYAYDVCPNSEFLGIESKECQCQILNGTPIESLYRFENNTWQEFDFNSEGLKGGWKGDWKVTSRHMVDPEFEEYCSKCGTCRKQPMSGRANPDEGWNGNEIFSMRFNPDNVYSCWRKPEYPTPGHPFTVFGFERPHFFKGLTDDEICGYHIRLKAENGGKIGIYLLKNNADNTDASKWERIEVGSIYGLDAKGFLFEDSHGKGYFFAVPSELKEESEEICYVSKSGKASRDELEKYRF